MVGVAPGEEGPQCDRGLLNPHAIWAASPSASAPAGVRVQKFWMSSCSALRKPKELGGCPAGVGDCDTYSVKLDRGLDVRLSCSTSAGSRPAGTLFSLVAVKYVFLRGGRALCCWVAGHSTAVTRCGRWHGCAG